MTEVVDWLVQEVTDLLEVSPVGLYEFMWLLNKPDLPLGGGQRESYALMALERLLTDPAIRLVKRRWPQPDALAQLTLKDLPDRPWNSPAKDGTYFALDRTPGNDTANRCPRLPTQQSNFADPLV